MEKINFTNNQAPYIDGDNLNLMQNNIENAIEEKNTYLTEEQVIGTWHDGRPIYRQLFEGTLNNGESTTITSLINAVNSEVLKIYGYAGNNIQQHVLGGYVNNNWYSGFYINDAVIQLWVSTQLYQKPYKVIVEYLKRN